MATWLKTVRTAADLDQVEFARYIGKSRSAVGMYETGTNIPPDVVAAVLSAFPHSPPPPTGGEVLHQGEVNAPDEIRTILYAGVVPCSTQWGDPLSSEERRPIELKFAGRNRFLCKVSGHSCYPALRQGDLTVWELDREPPEGVIVLAERLEDQACTVKMLDYDRAKARYVLVPINPEYAPPEDGTGWQVTARLVGVIRQRTGPERTWYWEPGLRPQDLIGE